MIPFFVAEGASVTVLRTLASSAFGSYSLTPPEGIEVEDIHDFEAPGNELGYVASLNSGRRVGGLARRFVRSDVSVTAADPSDPDVIPESDVDMVLTRAAAQVSSDFFLESDIPKAGLGPWVPFVDFKVGDMARIDVWGDIVALPVTRIEPIISDHSIVDWTVHVGGQLVSDEDARMVENEALQKAFIQDRRELADLGVATTKAVAEASSKAESAQDTADGAQSSADRAQGSADEAGHMAAGLAHPEDSLVPHSDTNGAPYWAGSVDAPAEWTEDDGPPGYEPSGELHTATWYEYSDASSHRGDAAFMELSDRVDYKVGVWAKAPDGHPDARAGFRLVDEDGEQCIERWRRWTPRGEWQSGDAVYIFPDQEDGWYRYEYVVRLKPGAKKARVSIAAGGEYGSPLLNRLSMAVRNVPKEDMDAFQSKQIAENNAILGTLEEHQLQLSKIQQMVVGSTYSYIDYQIPSQGVGYNTFHEIYSLTPAVDIVYDIYYRVGWDAASHDDYSLSIWINGAERYYYRSNNLGPLFPWEDGYRRAWMTRNGVRLNAGDTISFRVWSNAGASSQRRVRDGVINMSQVT